MRKRRDGREGSKRENRKRERMKRQMHACMNQPTCTSAPRKPKASSATGHCRCLQNPAMLSRNPLASTADEENSTSSVTLTT